MKTMLICFAACAALLTGCAKQNEEKIATLEAQVKTLEADVKQAEQRNETLQGQVTDLDGKLRDAQAEAGRLRVELERASTTDDRAEKLSARITQLEAEIERLKKQPEAPTELPVKPAEPEPQPAPEPAKPDPEVVKRLDELLPMIKAADSKSMETAYELIVASDKQTRDDFIARVQQWVKDEPQSKVARLALATVLVSRFRDLKDPMKQGALAGQIKTETEKAIEIDPEYYDAVHFLAVLQVNYPTFTPEFKDANTTLDKALSMQENMTWEDRFAEIYAAYGMWYRMQEKYEDAAAWVQKGLDKAPRDQGLLDEQKAIEDAKLKPED
jgi:outer membrane murein-binding lipoprotein Lpp